MMHNRESLLTWLLGRLARGFDPAARELKLACSPDELAAALLPVAAAASGRDPKEAVRRLGALPPPRGLPADAGEPGNALLLAASRRSSGAAGASSPEVAAQLAQDLPLLRFELGLTAEADFLDHLGSGEPDLGAHFLREDAPEGACPRCAGALPSTSLDQCPSCGVWLATVRLLPFVPAAVVQASYRALREMVRWPEVVSFGPEAPILAEWPSTAGPGAEPEPLVLPGGASAAGPGAEPEAWSQARPCEPDGQGEPSADAR